MGTNHKSDQIHDTVIVLKTGFWCGKCGILGRYVEKLKVQISNALARYV
jgi:hypothetical protein